MVALAFIVAMVVGVAIDMPYKELQEGKHYDCKVSSIPADNTPEQREWFEYCAYEMKDHTKNKYGETRDWKDGQWK